MNFVRLAEAAQTSGLTETSLLRKAAEGAEGFAVFVNLPAVIVSDSNLISKGWFYLPVKFLALTGYEVRDLIIEKSIRIDAASLPHCDCFDVSGCKIPFDKGKPKEITVQGQFIMGDTSEPVTHQIVVRDYWYPEKICFSERESGKTTSSCRREIGDVWVWLPEPNERPEPCARAVEIANKSTLNFPCSPAELLNFIDVAPDFGCLSVPQAFRRAVQEQQVKPMCSEESEVDASDNEPKDAPTAGMSKQAILGAEWPFTCSYSSEQLQRDLGNAKKIRWIDDCRVGQRGAAGKDSSRWNPALLALALVERKKIHKNLPKLDDLMNTYFPKSLPEWEELKGKF